MSKTVAYKFCHHYPVNVLTVKSKSAQVKDVAYYVADRFGSRDFEGDLIVNLTSIRGARAGSTTYDIPQLAKHMIDLPKEIVIAWDDYSSPPVKFSFWEAFHNYVVSKKYTSVCFHCEHGHGRTGTAMCAMLITLLKMDVEAAVKYLREAYCKEVVESETQILYLINLDMEINNRGKVLTDSETEKIIKKLKPSGNTFDETFDFSNYIKRLED